MRDMQTIAARNLRSFIRNATFKNGETDRDAANVCVDVLTEHPTPANPAQVTDACAADILRRLTSGLEYFHMAPDDADVWIGGWSKPEATAITGTVKAGEIRAAIAAIGAGGQAVAGEGFCKGDDSYQDDERDFKTFRITRCLNGKGEHYDQIDVHGDEKLRDRIIDLLNGSAISNPPAQPGWRMVPEEPTEEMRDDAWNALNSRGLRHFGMSDILAIWKAMLTAVPLPGGAK